MGVAIASAGNGNWGTAGTWNPAQVPTATDTVTITHTITYDVNDDVNTIGAITINGGGTLQWAGGVGTKTLRCASITVGSTTAGNLIGKDGTFIRCLGALTLANITNSSITMQGTVPNSQTTLSADASVGDGYLQLTSVSGFGVGDWISVYDYTNMAYNDRTDEVFYVHAISGSNMYVRRMVGPEFTLTQQTSIGDNTFYISEDTRAWEAGMKFVIDTEVFEVSSIDIVNRIIYSTANATANHTATTKGYESGVEIAHASGDYVYKLAATIIGATSGNNYIDVSSAGGWSNNDELAIGGAVYTSREMKIIQSISVGGGSGGSDRITLTSNLSATHTAGGLVVKLNRDCVFHGNTSDSTTGSTGYITVATGTNVRTAIFDNVEVKYNGSGTSHVGIGISSTATSGMKRMLNCVHRHSLASYGQSGIGGSYIFCKNFVSYEVARGFAITGNGTNNYVTGTIVIGNLVSPYAFQISSYANCLTEYNFVDSGRDLVYIQYDVYGNFGTTYSSRRAWGINYFIGNYALGPYFAYPYTLGLNKIKLINLQSRPYYVDGTAPATTPILRNFYYDTYVYTSTAFYATFSTLCYHLLYGIGILENYNLIKGNHRLVYSRGYGEMDEGIKKSSKYSWKFTSNYANDNNRVGFFAIIYGRKNAVINVGAWLRYSSTYNGTTGLLRVTDDFNNTLASDTDTAGADAWDYLKATYTCTDDRALYVLIGDDFSTGNMWIDQPQIDPGGCIWESGVMSNFWKLGNPNATGTRLLGQRIR